jgi:hypothetical protein
LTAAFETPSAFLCWAIRSNSSRSSAEPLLPPQGGLQLVVVLPGFFPVGSPSALL